MPTLYSPSVARGAARSTGAATGGPGRQTRQRGRGSGGGVPWLWVGLLVLIGVAVFAARTVKLPRTAEPTPTAPGATAQSAQPTAVRATPLPVAAKPTGARTGATPAPARGATVTSISAPVRATPVSAVTVPTPGQSPPAAMTGQTPVALGGTPVVGVTPAAFVATPAATAPSLAARGPNGEVALTFDAGADRGYAQDILDILQEQHVLASFGITGVWARANPDLVRRMAADGHMVFNHTLDHQSFTGVSDKLGGLSAARRRAELDDADAIIAPLLGHTTKPWYRLPYGDDDAQVAAEVAPDGYSHKLGWTVDSLGWRGSQSADIVARCLKLAAPGAVYVFHVGRASQDAIALPQVIAGLRDKGFGFRRADQA